MRNKYKSIKDTKDETIRNLNEEVKSIYLKDNKPKRTIKEKNTGNYKRNKISKKFKLIKC